MSTYRVNIVTREIYFYCFQSPSVIQFLRETLRRCKYKMAKAACMYVNKLADINIQELKELCIETIKYLDEHHQCSCRAE